MRLAIYTNSVSAHQLPLARELVRRLGGEAFRYIHTEKVAHGNQEVAASEPWIVAADTPAAREWLERSDVILSGIRDLDLFERRLKSGRHVFYMSERWFKPIEAMGLLLPGWIRMLCPSYFRMVSRFISLFGSGRFKYFPIGPWAMSDVRWMGRVLRVSIDDKQLIPWGYFVSPSMAERRNEKRQGSELSVLWVGRPIGWKRVDTIKKAVSLLASQRVAVKLDLFSNLKLDQVRAEMRKHDVYVLASNGEEGWGAALSEAMEEGMLCLGTDEAGASAALLPSSHRFRAGNAKQLAELLRICAEGRLGPVPLPLEYTASGAADMLVGILDSCEIG